MHEDALAVEAVKSGDRERYAELVHRYERMVYAIAWSHLGHRDLCDEAAQETFFNGFRFLAALRNPDKYASWIARIARNVAFTIARRRRRQVENERQRLLEGKNKADLSSSAERVESLTETLQDVVKELPPNQRECLVLYYLQERNTRECAEALGVREETFRVRLHRARNALRMGVQDRLERSLKKLGPKKGLDRRVLSVVPAAPMACGASGFGGVGAIALTAALQLTPLLLLLGWAHRQIVQNFRSAQDYRRDLQRRHLPRHFAMMIVAAVAGAVLYRRYGAQVLGLIVALFLLPAMFRGFLFLRVNRTRFALANALGSAAMFLAFSVQALEGGSYYWAFLAAMLFYNVALWTARKSMPGRFDYHLALRATFDELGHIKQTVSASRRATSQDMRRFARFLGELFLIFDYSIRKQECVLAMPSITLNAWRILWPWREFALASRIVMQNDGTCSVILSKRDWNEITAVCSERDVFRAALEARIADTLEQAWAFFLSGREEQAKALLQPRPDEQILIRPIHELRSMTVIYLVGIIGAVVALALWLSVHALITWGKDQSKEPVRAVAPLEFSRPKNTGSVPHHEHVTSVAPGDPAK